MDTDSYILKRIGSAKLIGMIIGLVGFFLVPSIWPGESMWLRAGVLLWYTTVGVVIGVIGLIDRHPMFHFSMTYWFRGPVVGIWFNLVLVFLMHDKLTVLMTQLGGSFGGFSSPFWIVPEGAVVGLIIDTIATKIAGEGMPGLEHPSA